MPVVFVHGVNVRRSALYDQTIARRDAYFHAHLPPAVLGGVDVFNPYWGDSGAKFSWNLASVPSGPYETFGTAPLLQLIAEIAPGTAPDDAGNLLLSIARKRSLLEVIDLLWGAQAHAPGPFDTSPALIAESAQRATTYAAATSGPAWLADVRSDDQLISRLLRESAQTCETTETFGPSEVFNALQWAIEALRQLPHETAAATVSALRGRGNAILARFIGDACVYVTTRGRPGEHGPIVQIVVDALQQAAQSRTSRQPLVVVAHSLGGIIAYDALTSFAPTIPCDVLITVGSQIALFEEMKQFVASDPKIPNKVQPRAPKPANVKHWINVFDLVDALSYSAGNVFSDVKDVKFNVSPSPLAAHVSYFERPTFYQCLSAWLAKTR